MEDVVTQRVNEFREKEGLSIRAFALKIGMLQETLNKQLKEDGRGVSISTIVLILAAYPDLSAEWLLRGEGEMKKGEEWKVTQFIPVPNKEVEQLEDHIKTLKELNAMLREKIRVMEAEKKAAPAVPYPYAADKS
jgi:transcriptional regulator with XRE-family HTH domain